MRKRTAPLNLHIHRIRFVVGLLITLVLAAAFLFSTKGRCGPVDDMAAKSTFIFRGTVSQVGAATMPDVPITDRIITVRVDEVLRGAPSLYDFTGKDITVQLREPHSLKAEAQAVFFTNGWLYGQGLAVVEVGHLDGRQVSGLSREEIRAALERNADADLQARLAISPLVIAGEVSEIRPAPEQARGLPQSEHNPEWRQAVVKVETVLKGNLDQGMVVVLFPSSRDAMWMSSPKFEVGQRGIWILEKDQQEKGLSSSRLPGLTALAPLDFQLLDQFDRVKRLLKTGR